MTTLSTPAATAPLSRDDVGHLLLAGAVALASAAIAVSPSLLESLDPKALLRRAIG